MKQFNVFLATLALTCFALMPTAANAGDLDDLDVTMEVVDDVAGITDVVSEMRGPDSDGAREGDDIDNDSDDDSEDDGESDQAESDDRDSDDDREDGRDEDTGLEPDEACGCVNFWIHARQIEAVDRALE